MSSYAVSINFYVNDEWGRMEKRQGDSSQKFQYFQFIKS